MANTLAYYDTATITAIKSFIVQAHGVTVSNSNLQLLMVINNSKQKIIKFNLISFALLMRYFSFVPGTDFKLLNYCSKMILLSLVI